MMYLNFPQPIEVDEGGWLVVHRNVLCEHIESRHCECVPWVYTQEELWRPDFIETLNSRLRRELQ